MGDIVNLRRARKAKVKAGKDDDAARNRVAFGESKAARALREALDASAGKRLDGHRLTKGGDADG